MGALVYLKNAEIDREKWDECIYDAPQGVIFALSWYLDFCESEWEAVVEIEDGRYLTVMPVQLRTKYMFTFIHKDLYSSVLGVFSIKKDFGRDDFLQCIDKAFERYRYIAKYRFNPDNNCFFLDSEIQTKYLKYHLALNKPYEVIKKEYSKERRRNLRKSQEVEQFVHPSKDYAAIVEMFGKYTLPKVPNIKYQPEVTLQLFELADRLGYAESYFVCEKSGDKLAGGVFFKFKDRITAMFGSTTSKGKKYNSRTMLMDYVFQLYANSQYNVLDFGGGNDPGVAHFKRGLGAKPFMVNEVQISKFPQWVNSINSVRRKLIKSYLSL